MLHKVTLNNFGVFKGQQSLVLSIEPEMNTVILSFNNGSGKTTLIEGIFWCLYGKKLNQKTDIDYAFDSNKNQTEISVTLLVDYLSTKISLSRKKYYDCDGKALSKEYLLVDGKENKELFETIVERILPLNIVWFYKVSIEQLTDSREKKVLETGLKKIFSEEEIQNIISKTNKKLINIGKKDYCLTYENKSSLVINSCGKGYNELSSEDYCIIILLLLFTIYSNYEKNYVNRFSFPIIIDGSNIRFFPEEKKQIIYDEIVKNPGQKLIVLQDTEIKHFSYYSMKLKCEKIYCIKYDQVLNGSRLTKTP